MSQQFAVNDLVMYGASGLCTVASLQSMQLPYDEEPQEYYLLHPVNAPGSSIFVPSGNEKLMGRMHAVLNKQEIELLLRGEGGKVMEWVDDRNARSALFHSILGEGDEARLVSMVRCLYLRRKELMAQGKRLNGGDDAVLKSAERLVESEFCYVLGIDRTEVGEYIASIIEKSE